jgi:outer membrane lipoprotein SlyB
MAGALLGGVAGAYVGMKLSRDQNAEMISELEGKKDFEVSKDEVSRIELKKPSFVSRGHIVIASSKGEDTKILIADKKDYERVMTLMQAFLPGVIAFV